MTVKKIEYFKRDYRNEVRNLHRSIPVVLNEKNTYHYKTIKTKDSRNKWQPERERERNRERKYKQIQNIFKHRK